MVGYLVVYICFAGIKAAVAGAFNLLLVPGDRRWFWTGSTAGRAQPHIYYSISATLPRGRACPLLEGTPLKTDPLRGSSQRGPSQCEPFPMDPTSKGPSLGDTAAWTLGQAEPRRRRC